MIQIDSKNYVAQAQKVMAELDKASRENKREKPLTTSKIRSLLTGVSEIYNDVAFSSTDSLDDEIVGRIQYLKVRFAYESGREKSVDKFVKSAGLMDVLDSVKDSKQKFILFERYMEALVAYHKFYGGE